MDQINETLTSSIKIIAMMLLIIGGGGAFKQVLVDSGMDKYIASIMARIQYVSAVYGLVDCCGTAYCAGFGDRCRYYCRRYCCTKIADNGVSPNSMVIAVGSGSVIFSHVNDPGFWLFKEYFKLTIGETIRSSRCWETIIPVCGLIGCLLLGMMVV